MKTTVRPAIRAFITDRFADLVSDLVPLLQLFGRPVCWDDEVEFDLPAAADPSDIGAVGDESIASHHLLRDLINVLLEVRRRDQQVSASACFTVPAGTEITTRRTSARAIGSI